MIWIVLVLAVLFVAMSCVALWYRGKWQDAEKRVKWTESLADTHEKNNKSMFGNMLAISLTNDHLRKENAILKAQLPARDSKGRFCKK